jgi:hypothetical protein
MARVGQVPRTMTKVGFSLSRPFVKNLRFPIGQDVIFEAKKNQRWF